MDLLQQFDQDACDFFVQGTFDNVSVTEIIGAKSDLFIALEPAEQKAGADDERNKVLASIVSKETIRNSASSSLAKLAEWTYQSILCLTPVLRAVESFGGAWHGREGCILPEIMYAEDKACVPTREGLTDIFECGIGV